MARHKLTDRRVKLATKAGFVSDGHRLNLNVRKDGTKHWVYRYTSPVTGAVRDHGLGSLDVVPLARAREKAQECDRLVDQGKDPIEEKRSAKAARRAARSKAMSFEQCARAYFAALKPTLREGKHADQWLNPLTTYIFPKFGSQPVSAVDTPTILPPIEALWTGKHVTARRVLNRIEVILDWATAREYRSGPNPARWKGHMATLLPKRGRALTVQHHPSLPYDKLPAFWGPLREQAGLAAAALRLLILTATRTGEVINAVWSEFDLEGGVWSIPGERTKTGKLHRVPLSEPALAILRELHAGRDPKVAWVFPGVRNRPLSNMAMLALVRRMGREDIVPHGFRSTFRTWCSERTSVAHEIAEAALGHAVADAVVETYRRTDFFDRRVRLMQQWGAYVINPARKGEVVPMRSA